MKIKSIDQLKPAGKTVLVRTDFNVPLAGGQVADDFRIRAGGLKTLNYLSEAGAKTILITHLGRPRGWEDKLSLEPVAKHLGRLMGIKTIIVGLEQKSLPKYEIPHLFFLKHNIEQSDIGHLIDQMKDGDIAFLENMRFYPGEKEKSEDFAKLLAKLAGIFVNDGFAISHREDASVVEVPKLLPSYAGFDLVREIEAFGKLLGRPKKPFVIMIGGMKLETKVPALLNLAKQADTILVGGGMANILLLAKGFRIGKSVYDEGEMSLAKRLVRDYSQKIKLPRDVVVSTTKDGPPSSVPVDRVKSYEMILDIGPKTIQQYSKFLREGKTLLWNGPMGYFENKQFSHGTFALARFFSSRSKGRAYGVAGGGETLQVISGDGLEEFIDHISTGGGAMLDFLAGKSLPGIDVLRKD